MRLEESAFVFAFVVGQGLPVPQERVCAGKRAGGKDRGWGSAVGGFGLAKAIEIKIQTTPVIL